MKFYKPPRDGHRMDFNDLDWAAQQPPGVRYFIGDLMEFEVGGFGVIREVTPPLGGWPASYATKRVDPFPDHPRTKRAWHYELDFKRRIL